MNFSQLDLGVFVVKIYGFIVSAAFFVGSWHFYKSLQEKNFSIDFFLHHYWRWLVGAILVGRMVTILFQPEIFNLYGFASFFAFWEGEINFYGAMFGFLTTMYLDLKYNKKSPGKWFDLGITSFLLGILITDLGAFLTGALYGRETVLPWGIQYETFGVEIVNPVHPLPLYAFILHLILLQWTKEKQKKTAKTPGKIFLKTLTIFLLIDFLLQFLRGDFSYYFFNMRIAQWIDLCIILIALWICYGHPYLNKKLKKNKK